MDKQNLYNIAIQCARLNSKGCAKGCEQCQFNVFNYVDDIREASLLKANAYTDYYNEKALMDKINSDLNTQITPLPESDEHDFSNPFMT